MKQTFVSLASGFGTLRELFARLLDGPYWFLVPLIVLLLPAALVLIFLQAVPVVAPFVYTIF